MRNDSFEVLNQKAEKKNCKIATTWRERIEQLMITVYMQNSSWKLEWKCRSTLQWKKCHDAIVSCWNGCVRVPFPVATYCEVCIVTGRYLKSQSTLRRILTRISSRIRGLINHLYTMVSRQATMHNQLLFLPIRPCFHWREQQCSDCSISFPLSCILFEWVLLELFYRTLYPTMPP